MLRALRALVQPQEQSEQRAAREQQLQHEVGARLARDLHELFHAAMLDRPPCDAISAALRPKPQTMRDSVTGTQARRVLGFAQWFLAGKKRGLARRRQSQVRPQRMAQRASR